MSAARFPDFLGRPMLHLFTSEPMQCAYCALTQRCHPAIESGWYVLCQRHSGQTVYICPPCLGNLRTPACPTCGRFYHEDYPACPWCVLAVPRHLRVH